jgi:hypothetical protein
VTEPAGHGWIDRIATFAGTTGAALLVGAWAFAEAIVLPIVPDVALGLLALAAPRRAASLFAAALAGALAGSLVLAWMTVTAPAQVDAMLRAIPAIDGDTIANVAQELDDEGVAAFVQLGPGPPLKVYTAQWVETGGGAIGAIGVVLNRITRVGPVVLVAAVAGWVLGPWLRRHDRPVVGVYVLAWTFFYAAYWAAS